MPRRRSRRSCLAGSCVSRPDSGICIRGVRVVPPPTVRRAHVSCTARAPRPDSAPLQPARRGGQDTLHAAETRHGQLADAPARPAAAAWQLSLVHPHPILLSPRRFSASPDPPHPATTARRPAARAPLRARANLPQSPARGPPARAQLRPRARPPPLLLAGRSHAAQRRAPRGLRQGARRTACVRRQAAAAGAHRYGTPPLAAPCGPAALFINSAVVTMLLACDRASSQPCRARRHRRRRRSLTTCAS